MNNKYLGWKEAQAALDNIRQEWEEAAEGQPLEEIYGSVGLLLNDISVAIGLEEVLEPIA